MKVAAYQAPYLPFGSFEAVDLIGHQITQCETRGVELLCCPEAILGGLAHESAGQSPADVALGVENGELAAVLSPLMGTCVSVIVGFTERDVSGDLYISAAVLLGGQLAGVYRKVYPGYRTVIGQGTDLPVYQGQSGPLGVMICNDIWYIEPARVLSARGAAVILVPSNSGHVRSDGDASVSRARGVTLPIARAVENTTTIVVADIAGRNGTGRRSAAVESSIWMGSFWLRPTRNGRACSWRMWSPSDASTTLVDGMDTSIHMYQKLFRLCGCRQSLTTDFPCGLRNLMPTPTEKPPGMLRPGG